MYRKSLEEHFQESHFFVFETNKSRSFKDLTTIFILLFQNYCFKIILYEHNGII